MSEGWGVGRKSGLCVHSFLYLQLLSKSSSLTVPSAALEIQKIHAAIDFPPINLLIDFFFLLTLKWYRVKSYAFLLMEMKWPTISELYKFHSPLRNADGFFFPC